VFDDGGSTIGVNNEGGAGTVASSSAPSGPSSPSGSMGAESADFLMGAMMDGSNVARSGRSVVREDSVVRRVGVKRARGEEEV
jgi:hypothetical protein